MWLYDHRLAFGATTTGLGVVYALLTVFASSNALGAVYAAGIVTATFLLSAGKFLR